MIIKEITLENFRQYYGRNVIEFAHDKTGKKNVTIIYGEMGCGKSNLFQAINWCFYGTIDDSAQNLEVINKDALSRATQSDKVKTKVIIRFSHEGRNYTCIRRITACDISVVKDPQGNERFDYSIDPNEDPFFLSKSLPTGESDPIKNGQEKIESILPSEMRKYFFFDGEKIDELSKPGHEEEVKDGIKAVLQLEAIPRAIAHMKQVCSYYTLNLRNNSSGDLQSMYDQRLGIERGLESRVVNL